VGFGCAGVRAAEESDLSAGLPSEYAKHYVIASATLSPDKNFAVIVPKEDPDEMSPKGKDYLVALNPFAILGALDTEWPYFRGESHGGINAEWSKDSSVALVTLDSKWGPGDVFLLELRGGKLARMTNLLATVHDLLLPDYRKAKPKPEPYNDLFDFIFEAEDPICRLEGTERVKVDGHATTDPKGVAERRWNAHVIATWDIAQGRFIEQKITRAPGGH
jgi:hypothetical protein